MLNVMYDLEYDRDACWIWLIFYVLNANVIVECDRYPWMWSNLNSWILHHLAFHRRDQDGKVVSTSMRNIQQMMMSRPVEVAVAPKTSLS